MLKTFALLFICFSLFAGGIAQATMPCCMPNTDMTTMQMDDAESDAPCHKMESKSDDRNHNSCEKCEKCNSCVGANALLYIHNSVGTYTSNAGYNVSVAEFDSHYLNLIDSPPKLTS